MAVRYPEAPPDGAPTSESRVHEALGALADSWTVLWDVPIGLFGTPRRGLRQIDFLLLHERLGLIVLEVKGGDISVTDGEWSTRPRGSENWVRLQRSPFVQAADQRFHLQRYLSRQLRIPRECFSHAVALPAIRLDSGLGPDAPRELILDADDLLRPANALHRIRDQWGECPAISEGLIRAVVSLLKPSFTITIVSATSQTSAEVERETRRQVDLVESQLTAFRTMLEQSRVAVLGGAGTGKTVLAAERARQLANLGSRTLLLCHRAAVRSFLHTLLNLSHDDWGYEPSRSGNLHLAHWTGLLQGLGMLEGQKVPSVLSTELVDWFLSARDLLSAPYDALVVDEGQEFTPRQIEALSWLLDDPEESPLYVFADPFQHSGLFSSAPRDRAARRGKYRWEPPFAAASVILGLPA